MDTLVLPRTVSSFYVYSKGERGNLRMGLLAF
jgi:hypothetical protein